MPKFAVLLIDLQKDFLDSESGRMPVMPADAEAVLKTANQVLAKTLLADALPILVVNEFSPSAHIANAFRKRATVAGRPGAELDARLHNASDVRVVTKSSTSGFSNPELDRVLLEYGIQELYVLGVHAESCVCATVVDAIELGFTVHVLANAVGSSSSWKKRFALWTMKRSGANILDDVPEPVPTPLPVNQVIW